MSKTNLVFVALLFTTAFSFSQDIITTKDGTDILGKVIEIGHAEVKYKKYDNPDGPVYVELKSNILMIRYENGSKEVFNQAPAKPDSNPNSLHPLQPLREDEKLFNAGKVAKYTRMKHAGTTFTVLGGLLFVLGGATLANSSTTYTSYGGPAQTTTTGNPELGAAAFLIGAAGLGVGIPLWAVGGHNVQKYSKKLEGLSMRFKVNPQATGVSLSYRF